MKKKTSRCFTKTGWLPRISKTSIGKVTMKSRKDINTYESYSERCAKKIKREATTNSITKTESPSSLKSDVIDLCEVKEIDLLPGTPLKDIKTTNSLFYMYDPRGYFDNPLPKGYCKGCRCPQMYCANTVYGLNSYNRVNHIIDNKGQHLFLKKDVIELFEKVYATLIEAHTIRNNIEYGEDFHINLPVCLKNNYVKQLVLEVQESNKRTDDILWNSDDEEERFDLTKDEFERFKEKYLRSHDDGERICYETDFSKVPCPEYPPAQK